MSRHCSHCDSDHPLTTEFWYRLDSSPKCKKRQNANRTKNYDPEKRAEYNKKYREANREKLQAQNTQWREENIDRHRANSLNYYYANKETVSAKNRARHKARIKVDLDYRLKCYLRSRMYNALKRNYKAGSAVEDLGCTVQELRTHLESKFQEGMSWDNYGSHWELDHVVPLANYDLTNREVYCRLAHYTNLQPLWSVDNKRKSNKESN